MKRIGQLKVMYKGMFIVMLLKSVSSAPVTSRTGRMKRKSFEGKPEGTQPIVNLGWARLSACRGGRSNIGGGWRCFIINCTTGSVVFLPSMKGKIDL